MVILILIIIFDFSYVLVGLIVVNLYFFIVWNYCKWKVYFMIFDVYNSGFMLILNYLLVYK